MNDLYYYLNPATQKTREIFGAIFPHPFFVTRASEKEPGPEWSFQTTTLVRPQAVLSPLLNEAAPHDPRLSEDAARYRVFPLVKAPNAPWPERISIGRARNNDVVLRDNSISKLHAIFMTGPTPLTLVDAGSRNGTRVNDRKLANGEKVVLKVSDTVVLGAVSLVLLDSFGLYDLIQTQLRK